MQWILDNKEWLFSGIGVLIISAIIGLIFRNKNNINQTQKAGKNSTSYQAAGDIVIKENDA